MKTLLLSISLYFFLVNNTALYAQTFTKARQVTVIPSQVLFENYSMILLPPDKSTDPLKNHFDIINPYTFIQVINDKNGKEYHVLYQTDFFGKVLLLAYSNNLSDIFNKKDKPFFGLQVCLREINKSVFAVQNAEIAIGCIVERLNYCSE